MFNFEGGCYAKMIRLSPEAEPEIYATTKRFGTVLENVVIDPETRELDLDDPSLAENTPRRLSDRLHPQLLGRQYGPGAEERRLPHRRRLRRAAADRAADARAGDVPFPLRLHRQGRRHRDRRDRARGDLLDLLRRAVHAALPLGLRQSPEGADRQGRRRLLAGQHRLDRRQIRRRQPHADQGDPRAAQRRARRQPRTMSSSAPTRISASRCRSACRASTARSSNPRDTWADKADYDATAAKLVDAVHRQFRQVRAPMSTQASATPRRAPAANKRNKSGRPSSARPDAQPSATFSRERAGEAGALLFFYGGQRT